MKKIAIITGANTGLGLELTKKLLNDQYYIIMACRNENKTINEIKMLDSNSCEFAHLDLEDRESIYQFSAYIINNFPTIDLLVNNAGVMMPKYTITKNNHELQFDTNYLGHALLTYYLKEKILLNDYSKLVIVASLAHRNKRAKINYEDITFANEYDKFTAYCQSKLANTMFGVELANKIENKYKSKVIIAHPGVSSTDLSRNLNFGLKLLIPVAKVIFPISNPQDGVEAIYQACTNDKYLNGDYVGPLGKREWSGDIGLATLHPNATNENENIKLWNYTKKELNI